MGLGGSDDSAGTTWRQAAGRQHARDYQRLSLPALDSTCSGLHALYIAVREQVGREASPSAAIIVKAPKPEPTPDQITAGGKFCRCKFALVIPAVPVHHVSAAFSVSWGGAGEAEPCYWLRGSPVLCGRGWGN
jgi:hypothetical protein